MWKPASKSWRGEPTRRSSRPATCGRRASGERYAVIRQARCASLIIAAQTWKKRWFVLRPAHLAFYKTSAEYKLLRLLDLGEIHACTPVALKKHAHTFGLVSPTRTFYLQAASAQDAGVDLLVGEVREGQRGARARGAPRASRRPGRRRRGRW